MNKVGKATDAGVEKKEKEDQNEKRTRQTHMECFLMAQYL